MCSTDVQVSQVAIEGVNTVSMRTMVRRPTCSGPLSASLTASIRNNKSSLRQHESDFWSKVMMGLPLTTAFMIGRLKQRRGEHNLSCWTLNSTRRKEVGKAA